MNKKSKNYIIGASGLIGKNLFKYLSQKQQTIGTYTKNFADNLVKLDLLNKEEVLKFIANIKTSDNIFLMSAISNPNWISENKDFSKKLNIDATKFFISSLKKINPRLIFMSSVEVFDGKDGDYKEDDKPNPLNYYGQTKFEIEKFLQQQYKKYTIVRTGWNIGKDLSSRCVVTLTYNTLLNKKAKMATDNYFSIIGVGDTVNCLIKLTEFPSINKIHFCSDTIINRKDLAEFIIKESINGKKMNFTDCLFSDINYSEPRGRVNNLNNSRSKKNMNIKYDNTYETILKKIRILDGAI